MWFIKVDTAMGAYWVFTQNVEGTPHLFNHFMTRDPRYAEAFGPLDVEILRHNLSIMMPSAVVRLVECSTSKILTPDMRRVLNLA